MFRAINHPLISHKITWMRKVDTDKKMFRELLNEVSTMLMYEASRDLPVREITVTTPLMQTKGFVLEESAVALIPILRAGLGMTDVLQDLLPIAKVGHIGLFRNEETLEPVEYYKKLPRDISQRHVFLLDPMLATGGSLSSAVSMIKKEKPLSIKVLTIISAPEGLAKMENDHPDTMIYTAQVDDKLNEKGYILPGLGDAGDRLFGTL
jgi:uracil phosphoribosyltransferase